MLGDCRTKPRGESGLDQCPAINAVDCTSSGSQKRSLRTESPWKMTDAVLEPQAAFDGNAEMADFLLKQGLWSLCTVTCIGICIVWAIRSAASI